MIDIQQNTSCQKKRRSLLPTSLMRWPMISEYSSLHNLVDTTLTAATFHICTMLNTHTFMLGMLGASLTTARFSHCPPPSTMLCTNSIIVKGLAVASTRKIAICLLAPQGRDKLPLQLTIGTPLMHALPDFLAIHRTIIGKVPVVTTKPLTHFLDRFILLVFPFSE